MCDKRSTGGGGPRRLAGKARGWPLLLRMCYKRSTVGPFGLELALEASLEVAPHRRPLVVEDAVPGRVAALAAPDEHVLPVHALEAGRERLQRPAGALVQR